MGIHRMDCLNRLMTCSTNYQIQNPHQSGNNASLYYHPVAITLGHGMLLQLRTVSVSHTTLIRDSLLSFILYITVNFLGPDDQWVVSGSDDGNFFVWEKDSAVLKGIYEGDSSVVNVIEGHPHFPLVAVSGIDITVKVCFLPTPSGRQLKIQIIAFFSNKVSQLFLQVDIADQIIQRNNSMRSVRVETYNIAALLSEARNAMGAEGVHLPGMQWAINEVTVALVTQ